MKRIKQQKIKEMRMKQSKFSSKIKLEETENNEGQINESEDKCMFCQEKAPEKFLCYVSRVERQNFYLNQLGIGKRQSLFSLTSCNHLLHFQCFNKAFGQNETFSCPLCKKSGNILLLGGEKIDKEHQMEGIKIALQRIAAITNILLAEEIV